MRNGLTNNHIPAIPIKKRRCSPEEALAKMLEKVERLQLRVKIRASKADPIAKRCFHIDRVFGRAQGFFASKHATSLEDMMIRFRTELSQHLQRVAK